MTMQPFGPGGPSPYGPGNHPGWNESPTPQRSGRFGRVIGGLTLVALGAGTAFGYAVSKPDVVHEVRQAAGLEVLTREELKRRGEIPSTETEETLETKEAESTENPSPTDTPKSTSAGPTRVELQNEGCLKQITPKEIVGTKIMASVHGRNLTRASSLFSEYWVQNVELLSQPKNLGVIKEFKASAGPLTTIAVNQEGGEAQVFRFGGEKPLPSQQDMANTHTPQEAGKIVEAQYRKLKELGVTDILGPVVDVAPVRGEGPLGERTFGSHVDEVVKPYTQAYVKAAATAGLQTTVEHFVGNGTADRDTDEGPTKVEGLSEKNWDIFNLFDPAVIGDSNVMVSTAEVPGLGKGPAAFSPVTYQFLEGKLTLADNKKLDLGEHLTVSDDLSSSAVERPVPEAVMAFWRAGGDIARIVHAEDDMGEKEQEFKKIGQLAAKEMAENPKFDRLMRASFLQVVSHRNPEHSDMPACEYVENRLEQTS